MSDLNTRSFTKLDYQEDFAKRLVNAVGFEDAIRECYENHWLGTLIYVERLRRDYRQK